ncbi:hypothetical protein [Pontivivens insulae]|uniref:DUF304 domain-containing protein n=1 Tax=Pontivivens insulae TaxID=1639689 RepID=A0A2R8A7K6_9RHOB|nr:hypothetical protein [Pontivivens insulae]RED18316.1 hypothetical protein DFR53_0511 [Pontivivens insulae]SPF28214.1 hypothetical protein POI8812_00512 [Pontivivens insulae]
MSERLEFSYRSWGMVLTVVCVGVMIFGFTVSSFFDTHIFPAEQIGLIRALVVLNLIVTPLIVWWLYRKETRAGRVIVLDADAIHAPPHGFSRQILRVPYDTIERIHVTQFKSNTSLHITHPGKEIGIPRSGLESDGAFNQLHAELMKRVQEAQDNG